VGADPVGSNPLHFLPNLETVRFRLHLLQWHEYAAPAFDAEAGAGV